MRLTSKFTLSKMLMAIILCLCFPITAFADGAAPAIDTGDTAWVIVATALVMFMVLPGIALFYGGLVRERNILSTMMYSVSSMIIASVIWVLWGYSLAFGPDVNGLIGGLDYLGFNGVGQDAALGTLTIPHLIFAIFQCMFAGLTVALISGAVAERMKFSVWITFSIVWVTLVYCTMAHWAWGGGWLSKLGGMDFAGGTVVHILSGVSALTAAIILGPRKGFPGKTLPPHNLVFFLIGGMAIWFGWFGFNAGSALTSGGLAALAFGTTQMAAAAGGIVWMFVEWMMRGKPTLVGAVTGIIAGLVAITPAAGFVSILSSLVIGGVASVVCYFGVNVLKAKFKYDDSLDVFGVHGLGGIWGAIATGIFASKELNPAGSNGLIHGNPYQVVIQLIDVGVAIALAAVGTFVILKVISLFTSLRATSEQEITGLDISFHGENAYNTFESGSSALIMQSSPFEHEIEAPPLFKPSSKGV